MKIKYLDLFQTLGLSKNEAIIYETLLYHGELGVSEISKHSKIHRRNVYDTMERLLERGLAFEVLEYKSTVYQAVNPEKLVDLIEERKAGLVNAMPAMLSMFEASPAKEFVRIYRGTEGLKTYMHDIIKTGRTYYSIGAKGIWADPAVSSLLESFLKDAKRKNIKFKILYDYSVKETGKDVLKKIPADSRFLPKNCKTPASLGVFGDYTVVLSDLSVGKIKPDLSFTVINNAKLAESVRTWFTLLWEVSTKSK